MKFLFLTDRYVLSPSATQICSKAIADELVRQGHSVFVVTLGFEKSRFKTETGVEVITIPNNVYRILYCESESAYIRALCKVLSIPIFFRVKVSSYEYTKAYCSRAVVKAAAQLITKESIDVVMSFSEPFSSHLVGNELKRMFKADVKWVAYEMDPFALNYGRPITAETKNRNLETEVLREADLLVFADGIMEENHRRNHLVEYESKSISLPLPGLEMPVRQDDSEVVARYEVEKNGIESDAVNHQEVKRLIYTGMFYETLRPPGPLLELLNNADFEFEMHFYGPIEKGVVKEYPTLESKCVFHGKRPREECDIACQDADILIDVQNDVPNQIPSKLFAYMSTGKPIVCLYSKDAMTGVNYLKDYPFALTIEKSSIKAEATRFSFEQFCLKKVLAVDDKELVMVLRPFSNEFVVAKLIDAVDL